MAQEKVLPKPIDWDELYPGRFLKAVDFKGKQVTLKISEVKIEELVGDKGPQIKGVISFDKTEKQLALNKTNGICLKEMFGKKVQEWVGKRITLFPSVWNGEDCIRVYGSPDIDGEKQLTITLPRKRPFQMTMHCTRTGAAPANSTNGAAPPTDKGSDQGAPPSDADSIKSLRDTQSLDVFAKTRKTIWAVYAAAKVSIPLEVEAAANEHREALEQRA